MSPHFSAIRKVSTLSYASDGMLEVGCVLVDEQLTLAAITQKTLTVWDLETGRELAQFVAQDDRQFLRAAITCSVGKLRAVTIDTSGRVTSWEFTKSELIAKHYPLHTGPQVQAFTAVDKFFLIGQGAGPTRSVYETPVRDGAVVVWDMTKSERINHLSHDGYSDSVSVTKYDGKLVAITGSVHAERPLLDPYDSESKLTAWDLSTGKRLAEPTLTDGPSMPFEDSCLTDCLIGTVVNDRLGAILVGGSGLTIWDLFDRQQVKRIACHGHIRRIFWSEAAAGVVLVLGQASVQSSHHWLRVFDIRRGELLADTGTDFDTIESCGVATYDSVIVCSGRTIYHLQFLTKEGN
ncbi:hypothetical protein NLG97_g3021 [Lecanicillium saksenae]|uniref:Uncharacterized protein n=1 Tax=Lecanicillium saksenae TaxID=468837 RepID=A0ACC1R154_9HYPO|nr:hypothetical protein NLG97_g3021 [Lecanicillium saksenae]